MGASGLIQTIFAEHWGSLKHRLEQFFPSPVADAARSAVDKMLACGTPALGFAQFRCEACGELHREYFSCKSRMCPRCGKSAAAEAAAQVQGRLLNVGHRHLTFSVPAELRPLLFQRRELLSVVAQAAAQATIKAIGTRCKKYAPVPGVMATVHTFGRDLGFHVHVHVLCTAGGLRQDKVWQPVKIFPATQYRRLWQYYLLKLLRQKLKGSRSVQRIIGSLHRKYPKGFIVNVVSQYRNGRKAAAYCCRYTGRPPISEKRILSYDGEQVSIGYKDYRDGQEKQLTLTAEEFMLRVLQHVWPRYQRAVHYYGLYQPSRRKELYQKVVDASRYGQQTMPLPVLPRWQRMLLALGVKELLCPSCQGTLALEKIQFRRKSYAAQTSQNTGPPAKRCVQLSLFQPALF